MSIEKVLKLNTDRRGVRPAANVGAIAATVAALVVASNTKIIFPSVNVAEPSELRISWPPGMELPLTGTGRVEISCQGSRQLVESDVFLRGIMPQQKVHETRAIFEQYLWRYGLNAHGHNARHLHRQLK